MTTEYAILPIHDVILKEIKDVGFDGEALQRVKKVIIRLHNQGVRYDIAYYLKDSHEEVTTTLVAEKSDILDNLRITTPNFSKDGRIRMGLCEVLVTVAWDNIPEVQIKYELLGKGV